MKRKIIKGNPGGLSIVKVGNHYQVERQKLGCISAELICVATHLSDAEDCFLRNRGKR